MKVIGNMCLWYFCHSLQPFEHLQISRSVVFCSTLSCHFWVQKTRLGYPKNTICHWPKRHLRSFEVVVYKPVGLYIFFIYSLLFGQRQLTHFHLLPVLEIKWAYLSKCQSIFVNKTWERQLHSLLSVLAGGILFPLKWQKYKWDDCKWSCRMGFIKCHWQRKQPLLSRSVCVCVPVCVCVGAKGVKTKEWEGVRDQEWKRQQAIKQ